jgi:hypothetical protein
VRRSKLWKKLLGLEHLVLEDRQIGAGPGGGHVVALAVPPAWCFYTRTAMMLRRWTVCPADGSC